jgi:hypothetical protein
LTRDQKIKVLQTDDAGAFSDPESGMKEPETYDEHFLQYNAFINGAKLWTFVPNVEDCSYNLQIFLNEQNETKLML